MRKQTRHGDKIANGARGVVDCTQIYADVNGGRVCARAALGICQYPRQSREKGHTSIWPKEPLKSFCHSSLFDGGQLTNPITNEDIAIPKINIRKRKVNAPKNPLTQAATTVSLKISKNALEILSLLYLLNSASWQEFIIREGVCQGETGD